MDMLVKLYEVQDCPELIEKLKNEGVLIKKAMTPDLTKITSWVKETFGQGWADECTAAILSDGCWIAVKDKKVIGFACYDATMKDFFGPTGVQEDMRGHGIGKALLIRCLISMKERGYAYAIIGSAGPKDFYRKAVGAIGIEGSIPGAYRNMVGAE
jgi:N-acetylglutamate synthase-like GNAT family acetyltransferase